ncbi:MAG: ABC transporter substrate-binding protein [Acidimicrobiia bacterium]|nr:ABC transporter substrate-binding protein [Acidimicrobiia bacterium]
MRIVSLLPSATEILFELGVGDQVVGVTHECDYPPAATTVTVVTRDLLGSGLSASEIDSAVAASISETHTIYQLDDDRLRALAPDVVVTQDLCEVCAVPTAAVEAAVCTMPKAARIVSADPHTLDELFLAMAEIGHVVRAADVTAAIDRLAARLATVRLATKRRQRPRVAVLEWPDPPYVPGHWVPDMVVAAGGHNVLGTSGQKSVRVEWGDVVTVNPDVVVLAFCGFDLATSIDHFEHLQDLDAWREFSDDARVLITDGSAYFSRPGPRLIDGVELLAHGLHGLATYAPPAGRMMERIDDRWVDLGA